MFQIKGTPNISTDSHSDKVCKNPYPSFELKIQSNSIAFTERAGGIGPSISNSSSLSSDLKIGFGSSSWSISYQSDSLCSSAVLMPQIFLSLSIFFCSSICSSYFFLILFNSKISHSEGSQYFHLNASSIIHDVWVSKLTSLFPFMLR